MSKLKSYIDEYSDSHQNKTNILIHKICVPAITFSLLGILKSIPVPLSWPLWIDFANIFVVFALVYYALSKNLRVVLALIVFIAPMLAILEALRPRFFVLSVIIFVIAWILQFIGHKIEGKKPSFLKDVQFLLIGPIWTMNHFLRAMGLDLKIN